WMAVAAKERLDRFTGRRRPGAGGPRSRPTPTYPVAFRPQSNPSSPHRRDAAPRITICRSLLDRTASEWQGLPPPGSATRDRHLVRAAPCRRESASLEFSGCSGDRAFLVMDALLRLC